MRTGRTLKATTAFTTVMPIVTLRNVSKTYQLGEEHVTALRDITLTIEEGEFVTIMGRSGSGKSTLLHIIGLLDQPSSGDVLINNTLTRTLPDDDLSRFRGRMIGFVFQTFNLINTLTAWENVALPLRIQGLPEHIITLRVKEALEKTRIAHKAKHTPMRMSGGERQRVAIARAIVHNPALILADEPTGNLDSQNGLAIAHLFITLHQEGRTIILVTHDEDLSRIGTRRIILRDGRIIREDHLTQKDRDEAFKTLKGRE